MLLLIKNFAALSIFAAALLIARPANADFLFTVTVETVVVTSSESGYLDVTLRNDSDPAGPVPLFDFALALSFSGDSGVTLDRVTRDPAAGYVFGSQGLPPPDYEDIFLPPAEFVFSDGAFNDDPFVLIGPASDPANIVRLARIHFTVGDNVSNGLRSITVDTTSTTFTGDEALVPFQVVNGGISVGSQNSAVVPEPGTMSMFLMTGGVLTAASVSFRRRRKASRA